MLIIRVALVVVATLQIVYGSIYLVAPSSVAALLGVQSTAPPWVGYILATAGARFIGFGIGILAAARAPQRHRLWILVMLAIQIIDTVATGVCVADGVLSRHNVGLALALPLVWVLVLGWASWQTRSARNLSG